jgi:hypothetical protein
VRELYREFVARLRVLTDDQDRDTAHAYMVASFNAATKSKKGLKPLAHYLSKPTTDRGQPLAQRKAVLAVLSQQYGIPLRRGAKVRRRG